MSGGSMDYVCYKLEEYAHVIPDKALKKMALDFANVLHDAEWAKDGDIDDDEFQETARKFKRKWMRKDVLKKYEQKERMKKCPKTS